MATKFINFQADWLKEIAKGKPAQGWLTIPKISDADNNRYYVAVQYSCIMLMPKSDFYITLDKCTIDDDAKTLLEGALKNKDYKRAAATGASWKSFTEYKQMRGEIVAYFNPKFLKYWGKENKDYYLEIRHIYYPAIIRDANTHEVIGLIAPISVKK